MSRFFKKADNLDELKDKELNAFLSKEKILGKVNAGRVKDFYNAFSTVLHDGDITREDVIDYDQFACKTEKDFGKINKLASKEGKFISKINRDILTSDRLMKAAAAAAYKFEKEMYNGSDEPNDITGYMRDLFNYHEDKISDMAPFGEAMEEDLSFMKYIALLSTKRAFAKDAGTLRENEAGSIIKLKPMESMRDVVHADVIEYILPSFNKKMATGEVYVRKRHVREEKGRNLIIMVDDSGSMNDDEKKAMLKAAITLQLSEYSEKHNVYIGTFICENFGFIKVKEKMKFNDLHFIKLNKGNTEVNDCVMDVIKMIKERKLKSFSGPAMELSDDHFEILVINDGADKVDPKYHPNICIHALCLKQTNQELKQICHRSGGTYNHIQGK